MSDSFLHDPKKLDSALSEFNRKLQEEEAISQARALGLQYINLRNFPIDLQVLGMLTAEEARHAESVVFYHDKKDLRVATLNPSNPLLREKISAWTKEYGVNIYICSKINFEHVLQFYSKVSVASGSRDETIRVVDTKDLQARFLAYTDTTKQLQATQTELLTLLFGAAVFVGASDIHLEPESEFVKVRFRLDGVLQDVLHLEKQLQRPITSRLKIQSKLKLNIETVPQDGRLTFYYGEDQVDVRVSTLPSAFGESIVMRLLNSSNLTVGFNDLGFIGHARDAVLAALAKPHGMVITTGPTGSGKTTTLYSFLRELNKPGVKIITLEDPVEYKLEGVTQTPIDHNANFSFAKGLRAVLRQDPDIVMVGEIRDEETADTASQAALTGHVVLSTLHTNDAAGAIPRLYHMGVKPFVIAPALNCIIAQRLVRKLCVSCKKQDKVDPKVLERIKMQLKDITPASGRTAPESLVFYKSTGCDVCHGMGYKGRIGIFEVIEMSPVMQELILKEPPMSDIKKLALQEGMVTLFQDGVLKALDGVTDMAEVLRVAGE